MVLCHSTSILLSYSQQRFSLHLYFVGVAINIVSKCIYVSNSTEQNLGLKGAAVSDSNGQNVLLA